MVAAEVVTKEQCGVSQKVYNLANKAGTDRKKSVQPELDIIIDNTLMNFAHKRILS